MYICKIELGDYMADIIDKRPLAERIKDKYQKFIEDRGLTKEQQEIIKKLKKEKKYDDIFTLYGQTAYLFNTPEKYIKNDIRKMLKNGNFEDIYTKYGASKTDSYMTKMEAIDTYMSTNSKAKGILSKVKNKVIKKYLAYTLMGAITVGVATPIIIPLYGDMYLKENAREYAEEIAAYDAKINEYAKQFQNLNLSDLQIIMKVMDDMWKDIKGYGNPVKDVFGYGRLDFLEPGGIGVCRNMADDVAAKLNVINSKYNARPINVYADSNKKYKIANIERKIIDDNSTVTGDNEQEKTVQESNENMAKVVTPIFGNHKVVIMDIPGEDYNLIVDPTNPSIGVFKEGKIYLFSTNDGMGLSSPYLSQLFNGFETEWDYQTRLRNSYQSLNLDELNTKWGIDAENIALNEAREIAELAVKNSNNLKLNSNETYTYGQNITIDSQEMEMSNGRVR